MVRSTVLQRVDPDCHKAFEGGLALRHSTAIGPPPPFRNTCAGGEKNFYTAVAFRAETRTSGVRTTMGATNPTDAAPGTIRGDMSLSMPDNLVHGSDSPESAEREIGLWFPDEPR